MRLEYALLVVVALVFGCVANQPGTQYVYVCNDGTQVSNLSLCSKAAPSQPNITKPQVTDKPKKQNQTVANPKNNTNKPPANQTKPQNKQNASDDGPPSTGDEIKLPTGVLNAQLAGTLLLGRPTNDSIALSILATKGMTAYSEYGTASGTYTGKTEAVSSSNAEPIVLLMSDLKPDTEYYYRVQIRRANETSFSQSSEHTFHTQRQTGEPFVFAVQADPHRDGHTDESLYRATLQNELAAKPDFLIDLGDTFMTEKFATSSDQVNNRYIQDREFFGIVSHSVPVFLVNGNHDGEQGWALDGTSNNDAIWATQARKMYYLPPYSDSFYSGSKTLEPIVGQRASYYAWEWGDALFVTLDPYWYTTTNPKQDGDLWEYTLGNEQYQWLKSTLENSHAKYKFVFEHHLFGDVRGSTYWAPYFEWGGKNKDGSWGFSSQRPGWDLPIHQLMVKNNVSIYFQGHDHVFVKEDLDGLVYQEVPQPGNLNGDAAPGADYNYHGITLPSSGYMRVSVSPSNVTVDYMKTEIGKAPGIAYSYSIQK
jgi:hypothetical protein